MVVRTGDQSERIHIPVTKKNDNTSRLGGEFDDFVPGARENEYLAPLINEGDEERLEAEKTPFRRAFDRYSYSVLRIYLTQFAVGIFGAATAMATAKNKGAWFLASGIFSMLFLAFLLHSVAWNVGANDRISVDAKRRKRNLWTGLLLGLTAGVPSFLVAAVYTVAFLSGAGNLAAVMKVLMLFSEGMYWTFLNLIEIGGQYLHLYWWVYFLMPLITAALVAVSYVTGYFNLRVTNILVEKGTEAEREAAEKKKKPSIKS